MIEKLSNFINPDLNKCFFFLGKDLISLPAGISNSRLTDQMIEIFLATFFFAIAQIFSIIGRTLLNFVVIVRCKPNFNLNYC